MSENEPPYEVGYGKPPQSGRFKKGQSGNSKGRPRGSTNLATVFLRESRRLVRMNGPSGSESVTKLHAAVLQVTNKAAQGDLRALHEYFSQLRTAEEAINSGAPAFAPNEKDHNVMENFLRRMQSIAANATSTNPESAEEELK